MSDDIKVSIICNAYNHEKYIRSALDGFVRQETSFLFEVLIHDDASTDRTADIIREYEKNYPKIIKPIYQRENQYSKLDGTIRRLQSARIAGKYVAICEGDDYWTDCHKLQKQYDFMESHVDYSLCACSTQWLNMLNGRVEKRCCSDTNRDISLEEILLHKDDKRPFATTSIFVRSNVWKNMPSFGFTIGDLPLMIYAALNGKVHMLADNMCVYRWYSEGSWTARTAKDSDRIQICLKNIEAFKKLNVYTDYQYNELIQKKIKSYQYTIALMKHDFAYIKNNEEMNEIFQRRDFIHKFSDWLRCSNPELYHFLQKLMNKKK